MEKRAASRLLLYNSRPFNETEIHANEQICFKWLIDVEEKKHPNCGEKRQAREMERATKKGGDDGIRYCLGRISTCDFFLFLSPFFSMFAIHSYSLAKANAYLHQQLVARSENIYLLNKQKTIDFSFTFSMFLPTNRSGDFLHSPRCERTKID